MRTVQLNINHLIVKLPIKELRTKRLLLRCFQQDDLDLFVDFFQNEGFIRFSGGNFTRERVAEFIDKILGWDRDGLPSQYVIVVRDSETPIGYCGFFHQQVDDKPEIEIGYRLHPDFWNQGKGEGPDKSGGKLLAEVRFASLEKSWSGPVQGGFVSRHRFIDHGGSEPGPGRPSPADSAPPPHQSERNTQIAPAGQFGRRGRRIFHFQMSY